MLKALDLPTEMAKELDFLLKREGKLLNFEVTHI